MIQFWIHPNIWPPKNGIFTRQPPGLESTPLENAEIHHASGRSKSHARSPAELGKVGAPIGPPKAAQSEWPMRSWSFCGRKKGPVLFDCLTLFDCFRCTGFSAEYEDGISHFVQIDLTRCFFSSEKMQSYCLGWLVALVFLVSSFNMILEAAEVPSTWSSSTSTRNWCRWNRGLQYL